MRSDLFADRRRVVELDRRHVLAHGVVDAADQAAIVREPDDASRACFW